VAAEAYEKEYKSAVAAADEASAAAAAAATAVAEEAGGGDGGGSSSTDNSNSIKTQEVVFPSLPPPASSAALHFARLFPGMDGSSPEATPLFTAILGGSTSVEKLAAFDHLINLASTIILVGEFALPFLALSHRVSFARYATLCRNHKVVCKYLMKKAKLRGTRIVLPVDIISADEEVNAEERLKCFENVDKDARDEGAEYEGDKVNVKINTPISADIPDSPIAPVQVSGFVYDVGSETCDAISQEISRCDLLFIWGTAGMCELSAFQAGHRAIVEASVIKPVSVDPSPAEPSGASADPSKKQPRHTIIIGDSTVEWFARMSDADGELGGDLVKYGRVAFAARQSVFLAGLISMQKSVILDRGDVHFRPSLQESEWVYNTPFVPIEEEDEDD